MTNPDVIDRAIAAQIAADADAEVVVGCVLADGRRPAVASSTFDCANCGALVWISNRILAALPDHARVVCVRCLARPELN